MQLAAFMPPGLAAQLPPGDSLRASVGHLLTRAYQLPCSTAAQAFSQLVQPTSRFQLALDALLPLLTNSSEVRFVIILVAPEHDSPAGTFFATLADATDFGVLYSLFSIYAVSDRYQPFQVCVICYVCQ